MTKKKRELLKFREGDCGLKIRKDGTLEVAGVDESGGMIRKDGMVNPVLLFAAAWARREQKVFEVLVQNFKDSVAEGFFGQEAKEDYARALKVQVEAKKNIAVQEPEKPVPFMKTKESEPSLGDEFETSSSKPTVTAATMSRDVASGAITFEQPAPLTAQGMVAKRDGLLVNGMVLDEKGVKNEDKQ